MTLYYSAGSIAFHTTSGGKIVQGIGASWEGIVTPGDTISATTGGITSTYSVASALNSNSILLTGSAYPQGACSIYDIALNQFVIPIPAISPQIAQIYGDSSTTNARVTAAGYYSAGDGGGGDFFWDPDAVSSICGIALGSAGLGYPTSESSYGLGIGGPGMGAAGFASVTGIVASVSLTNVGSNFTGVPSVSIAAGAGTATALATMSVASIGIAAAGANYTAAVSATIDPPPDSGDTAVAGVITRGTGGTIIGIAIADGGTRYTSAPNVSISDVSPGGGSGASASATLALQSIPVTNQGSAFTTAAPPAVTITGGGGAGAAATAIVEGTVIAVSLTAAGSQFSSAPTVSVSGVGAVSSPASFQAIVAADGGTNFFPNVTLSGAWRRIID